jgi:hypothetical protein
MSSGTTKFSSPQTWVEAWEMCKEIWKPCNNIKTYHYQQQDHGEEERKTSKHTQPCATSCLIPCENQWCHQPYWLVDQCKYTGGMVALLLSPHPPTQKPLMFRFYRSLPHYKQVILQVSQKNKNQKNWAWGLIWAWVLQTHRELTGKTA